MWRSRSGWRQGQGRPRKRMKSDHERARRVSLSIRLRCVRRSGVTHRRRGGLDIGNSSEAEAEAHGATESLNRRGTYHDAMRLGLLWRSVMPGSSDFRRRKVTTCVEYPYIARPPSNFQGLLSNVSCLLARCARENSRASSVGFRM
jgi:hypothetical protein